MRILVIEHNTWDDTNSLGNTLTNFFSNWTDAEFSYLYSRKSLPNNSVCINYYTIPEVDIIKKYFDREEIGREFTEKELLDNQGEKKAARFEKTIVKGLKIFDFGILRVLIDYAWLSRAWYNKRFKNFINTSDFNIIFGWGTNFVRLYSLLQAAGELTQAKIVLFFADDVTVRTKRGPFHYIHWMLGQKYMKKCIGLSSYCYGITQEMCNEYQHKFEKPFLLLRKGCDLSSTSIKNEVGTPIQIVYAGNLYYGRDGSLIELITAIEEINHYYARQVFVLGIYSNSTLPRKLRKYIETAQSAQYFGVKPYPEIMKILAKSDLVLHIESFHKKAIEYTRLSFSTKITDCMQSGSCLLAIGPDNVASMESIKQIPGAYLINRAIEIKPTLMSIAENPELLLQRAILMQEYAKKAYSVQEIREFLRSDFLELLNSKNEIPFEARSF